MARKLLERLRSLTSVFSQVGPTFRLVWECDRGGILAIGGLTLIAALLPPAIAWVGKLIVDAVVAAARSAGAAPEIAGPLQRRVLELVAVELGLVAFQNGISRMQGLARELLRGKLGNLVNLKILEKALELEVRHFEDAEVYDKMQNARREASSRPLSLVLQLLSVAQNLVTLASFAALLVSLSPWSVVVIALASIPAFVAEARMAAESFRLYSWRAPEGRKLNYLEWILTRDSHVKEVKLFGLGQLILGRYKALFTRFFDEDRRLALRRATWGFGLGLLSLLAFYGAYALVAGRASRAEISLGDMTLYLAVFRQGQGAFQAILSGIGSMYEDALFMSNLFAFLSLPTHGERPRVPTPLSLPRGQVHTIEFRNVSFRYPGKDAWALKDVNLVLRPGEKVALVGENGAGKSTLVKLLMRLYDPTSGEILYGGVDLRDFEADDLRSRIGAVFQDFVRYQFPVSENIGLGDVRFVDDRGRIQVAAERGGAAPIISNLPKGYDTPLGGWFESGTELSAGQWQKLAVSRAFMRDAEVLILDEPTASIDAEAEHELFQRFQALAADRTAIVISHRFSTVRMADRIAVFHDGRIDELGSHRELLELGGRYAHLFQLQARGYLD
jgi:ABC-type multidrug transport system fused ATPase/permease subunit